LVSTPRSGFSRRHSDASLLLISRFRPDDLEQKRQARVQQAIDKKYRKLAKEKPKEAEKEEETEDVKKAKMFWASMASFLAPVWPFVEEAAVSEILINGPREIFIERKGKLVPAGVQFTEELLRAAVMNIAQYVGKRVNEENPYMDARLPDGSRVAVVLPPCSRKGPCISIRKFSKEKMSLKDLISFGSLSEDVVAFLDIAVKLRKNGIVSGGTSSGKTSLLNVVSSLIPNDQRILVIEDNPRTDSERMSSTHATPLSRSASSGTVTSCSTSAADSPNASVWISTMGGENSG